MNWLCDWVLTLAKWHRGIPLVDALCSPGARGTALANEPKALVATETQRVAQLCACQAVHRAVYGVVWRAAISRYKKIKEIGGAINMHTDNIECNTRKTQQWCKMIQFVVEEVKN